MELKTKRLLLIPMTKKDLHLFHATNIDPFVRKYLWDDQEIPLEVSKEILEKVEHRFSQNGWGLWKITESNSNVYLGYAGLWIFFEEDQPQLLYALLPESTGKGYATEVSKKIIEYAFQKLNFKYLTAAMDKANKSSIEVCKRLNMFLANEKEIEGKATLFYKTD